MPFYRVTELQKVLQRGGEAWNQWRTEHPEILQPDLRRISLIEARLRNANLSGVDLQDSSLMKCDLTGANLVGANLKNVNLRDSLMRGVDLEGANLEGANLGYCFLPQANLREAKLNKANLSGVSLIEADLSGAHLEGALLQYATLVRTKLEQAVLTGCSVYGLSAWDLNLAETHQTNLVITREGEATIVVDNLEVAQFTYLLLDNAKLRHVIDTITSKTVLILGRFTPVERKVVLDGVRGALRERGYVPIMFDFAPSPSRDLTETIQLLANMAKFVVADLTDAKSIPQELSHIVPYLPSVPIQPILLASQQEYAMFEHWRRFPWVLQEFLYQDQADLIGRLNECVIAPVEKRLQGNSPEADLLAARQEIEELRRQLSAQKNIS